MTANELSTALACIPCDTEYDEEIRDKSAQELRTLSSANKWQADRLGKLETLNSWQASEINLFSADLKKAEERIAELEKALNQTASDWAKLHIENCSFKRKLNQYESIIKLAEVI